MKKIGVFAITTLFILVIVLLILFYKDDEYKYYNSGLLYINEIMPSNKYTIRNDLEKYSDYIELYNGYDEDINLEGFHLSDKDNYNDTWTFPKVTIKAKSYLLVYANEENKCNGDTCYTNFKLSKNGGIVSLTDSNENMLSKIRYYASDSDTSYGYNGNEYVYYYNGTPGFMNNGEESILPITRSESNIKLRITEYTNNNLSIIKDTYGEYVSVMELHNYGDKDLNLKGFHLSDSNTKPNKYTFDDVIIKSNEYLIVYLSEKDSKDNEIHTNFNLTTEDSSLILTSSKGEIIDNIKVKPLGKNMIASFYKDKWLYSYTNTFGKENIDTGSIDMLQESKKEKTLLITEVSSSMIEIKNISKETINLKDYGLSGNGSYVMKFPNINLGSNKYLVLYESDKYSYSNGKIYTGFKINNKNEEITLYNEKGAVLDTFTSGKISSNMSYGINTDGNRVIYNVKTLGYDNSNTYYTGYAGEVNFSIQGGYVDKGTKVTLSVKDDSTIYYTLDGSFPTNKSKKYSDPIEITKTTVIKAVSYKDNNLPSDTVSRTYLVGRVHDMAVVSISTDDSNLYSNTTGILVKGYNNNYKKDWERKISFEFYENDGTFGIMFNGGTKLVGQDSREYPQKSLAIHLRSEYGINEITYPLFTDHDVTTFSSFTLRNSGEDVVDLKFKDAYLIEVLKGQMDLDYQYYRPVVVYINGKYNGIYNIREKINESYLENNHDIEADVDLIKGNSDVRSGNINNYKALINYVKTHDMSKSSNYEYVKSIVDIQELINYWVVQTYYCNFDTGNIRFWRENTETGKWRWVLFDLDWSMHPATYRAPKLNYIFKPYGHGAGGGGFSTSLTYNLYKNAEFRDLYYKTLAYHMKNTFNVDRMLKIFDEVKSLYVKEMPYHVDRWYSEFTSAGKTALTMNRWNNNINNEIKVIKNRYNIVKNNIKSQFNLSNNEYNKYFSDI